MFNFISCWHFTIRNMEKRFIPTQCLQVSDKDFVPFWQLDYVKDEMCGEGFKQKDSWQVSYNKLIDCYWDTKKHVIVFGKVKNFYPEKIAFQKDENVFVEDSHDVYYEAQIVEILFEEYETMVIKIKKKSQSEIKWYFTLEEQKELVIGDIYEIRSFKPTYVLSDGRKITYDHQLKHKRK